MRIAYLDCFAGISGDMFLGALIDAGVNAQTLHDAAAAMKLGASIQLETVDRSGISSTKVHVLEAEPGELLDQMNSALAETQHKHGTNGPHTHEVEADSGHDQQGDGRSLSVIRELIRASNLAAPVIHMAIRTFELLGASEAKIHNVPIEDIHFHEVGAVDAIIDIVGACAGIHALATDKWVASPVNVGGGMVTCAHGRFPVPAPATADLLRGVPTYSANIQMELVTPTGAALLRMLIEEKGLTFGPQPAMVVDQIGYGAGTRNPQDFPNVLRLSIGEDSTPKGRSGDRHHSQTVTVLETALDDLSPQILAHVAEKALKLGALDVMLTPVIMKKGRPGTLLTVLCNPSDQPVLERLLLTETSTLGVRIRQDHRSCLYRHFETVATAYGDIRIKIGMLNHEALNANPEFEDCRAAAAAHNVPVKQVQQAAIAAYINASAEKLNG